MKKVYLHVDSCDYATIVILSIVSFFKTPQKDLLTSSLIVNIIPDFPAKVEWEAGES